MSTDEVLAQDCPICGTILALHSFEGLAAELLEATRQGDPSPVPLMADPAWMDWAPGAAPIFSKKRP